MNDKDIAVVKNAAKKNGFRYDPSSPFKKIKELKSQGVDAYFNFTVKRFSPDLVPLGSLPRKTLVLCNELGPYLYYKTDRYRFNNPDSAWDYENINILILGDSYTEGVCLPNNKNFSNKLRISNPRLINLGKQGNSFQENLGGIIEYATELKPKYIIWMHYWNDLGDMMDTKDIEILNKYVNEDFSQNLLLKTNEVEALLQKAYQKNTLLGVPFDCKGFLKLAQLRGAFTKIPNVESLPIRNINNVDFEYLEKIFVKAKKLSRLLKAELHAVSIPASFEIYNGITEESKKFESIIKKLEILFHKIANQFIKVQDLEDLYAYKFDSHLSPVCDSIIAKYIQDEILK